MYVAKTLANLNFAFLVPLYYLVRLIRAQKAKKGPNFHEYLKWPIKSKQPRRPKLVKGVMT